MENTKSLVKQLEHGEYDTQLKDIYVDDSRLGYQRNRYIEAVKQYEDLYGEDVVSIYSAPGRSEVGGNHTDHQHGMVLAASINLDAIAVVGSNENAVVKVVSDSFDIPEVSLEDLKKRREEEGTSEGIIRGVLAGLAEKGYSLGGFKAYITSDVLIGAGLSSSAAFETMIGTIISGMFNEGKIDPVEIAQVGQYAENVYFGKPCGLMDQMACSVGGMVHIDFNDPKEPIVNRVPADFEAYRYSLCIIDTRGSHADLTDDYALVPAEMKAVAAYFGKEVLREVSREELYGNMASLRAKLGDRSVLRALHFFAENERVKNQAKALGNGDFPRFLQLIKASGDSSFKYLQNVYTNRDIQNQSVSVALAVSEDVLGSHGASRVHGGGFAGTIQAFVENEFVDTFKEKMDGIFGEGACHILKVRKYGGIKVL